MRTGLVDERHFTRQAILIHISDIHFGNQHRFNPDRTPGGDVPARRGYPTLLEKLREDLNAPDPGCPVAICLTGDIVTTASPSEFTEAKHFVDDLGGAPLFRQAARH
jgi:3',5'-cyclic AMP phosphodiesterase CpdA